MCIPIAQARAKYAGSGLVSSEVSFYHRAMFAFWAMSIVRSRHGASWCCRGILRSGTLFCVTGAWHRALFHPCGRYFRCVVKKVGRRGSNLGVIFRGERNLWWTWTTFWKGLLVFVKLCLFLIWDMMTIPCGRCGTSDASSSFFAARAILCRHQNFGKASLWIFNVHVSWRAQYLMKINESGVYEDVEYACATLSALCTCRIALVAALCEFWYRSRNSLVTLCVSDRSRCGAVRILRLLVQPSRHFCACRVTLVVARCEIWHGSRSHLGTLCVSDRSRCHAVQILADSLRSWSSRGFLSSLKGLFQGFIEDLSNRSLHDPLQVLGRRSCGDPGGVLSKRSLHEDQILQMPCVRGACMKALVGDSWQVLASRFCKVLSSSSRSFYDVRCCDILQVVLAWRCWSSSFRIPCEKILQRSGWNPLAWSCAGPCEKNSWRSCWYSVRGFSMILYSS